MAELKLVPLQETPAIDLVGEIVHKTTTVMSSTRCYNSNINTRQRHVQDKVIGKFKGEDYVTAQPCGFDRFENNLGSMATPRVHGNVLQAGTSPHYDNHS